MRRLFRVVGAIAILGLFSVPSISAQTVASLRLYEQNCTSCHGNPTGPKNAPDGMRLRRLSADEIFDSIGKGPAHSALQSLSDDDKRLIAYYLGGRKVGMAD